VLFLFGTIEEFVNKFTPPVGPVGPVPDKLIPFGADGPV
jgi:hypothetical protein